MAQLPPKVPAITQNWHAPFPHHTTMSNYLSSTIAAAAVEPPSWVDEFLDFTSTRRGSHRRSISDSIAFLETAVMTPLMEGCHLHDNNNNNDNNTSNSNNNSNNMSGFDRLDDDQLLSMFSDEMSLSVPPPSSSNPSSPSSDQNSNYEEKPTIAFDHQTQPQQQQEEEEHQNKAKIEPGLEVESSCDQETHQHHPASSNGDSINIDPKRVKRILANRQSAQRSRVRKLQYISELERSVTTLQTEVSALSPRVAFLDHQRLILNVDNSTLKQRIAALAQDNIFKDAHQEALKKEIERLRRVYHHQQNLNKNNNNNKEDARMEFADKEQLLIN